MPAVIVCYFALAFRRWRAGRLSRNTHGVREICRKLQISETTFYRWKKKFGGLGVPELRDLRQLSEENRKHVVAGLSLDRHMLSEALKKSGKPSAPGPPGACSCTGIRVTPLLARSKRENDPDSLGRFGVL